jgi:hypothetical protein
MNKKEREQAEKLKATYEKLVARPLWKDILLWAILMVITMFAIEYFTVGEEEYFMTGPHLLRTFAKAAVMTAILVALVRWVNRRGLASINKKLEE